jgi:hypothetical protein
MHLSTRQFHRVTDAVREQYIKLSQLTTDFEWSGWSMVSTSARDKDLHAQLVRREPYTTTLKLTYWFEESGGVLVPDPTSFCGSTMTHGLPKPSPGATGTRTTNCVSSPATSSEPRSPLADQHDAEQVARLSVRRRPLPPRTLREGRFAGLRRPDLALNHGLPSARGLYSWLAR